MKIGFITTIDTNIGDDFIRTGIENIIDSIRDRSSIQYTYVNKHKPETAILNNSLLGKLYKIPHFKGKRRIISKIEQYFTHLYSIYKDQDLIIQSGAPVLWPNCHRNEWAQPIWYNTIGKLKERIPVLNLAAGSCYPWEKQEWFSNEKEADYAKDIGGFCKLTTTRDKLANKLFTSVGVKNKLMPCTAFFVDKQFSNTHVGQYILINYMEGGGHFDWNQHVNKDRWENTIQETISVLSREHEIRFICHNEKEVTLAKKLAPNLIIHYPKTVAEYLECIRHAKLGINNRMHASVAMGSVGVPSISVCTDTRLLMLENIGLPNYYVKDLNSEKLLRLSQMLLNSFEEERTRLFNLKIEKFKEYQELLETFIK